ncbi:androgen-dependent TFPI-regulating protein isoform X1 [Apis florea]|uniref:androgen-dependent TFPI-regulating protein isoform X1 n=1 Tax=Apis florea TaxID=7463 RepID=UPI0006293C4B|nr:androgen-dependent TFPI-regulating protein isoform X1 [Apis florea]
MASFLLKLVHNILRRLTKNFNKMTYTLNQLLHTSACLMYVFTLYIAFTLRIPTLNIRFTKFDPGQFKYLTIWDVIIQAVFFFICMLNDWFGTNAVSPKKPPFIRKLKDYIHAILSFPIAMFVGVTFWALMFVDRELVLPKAVDPYFPWWLNHLMHTMIMITILVETILAPRTYPKRSNGLLGIIIFLFIYLVWIYIIYYKSGVWVYPVLEVLSLPLRVVFFSTLITFSIGLYFIGEKMDNLFWGNEYIKHKKSYAKSK